MEDPIVWEDFYPRGGYTHTSSNAGPGLENDYKVWCNTSDLHHSYFLRFWTFERINSVLDKQDEENGEDEQ